MCISCQENSSGLIICSAMPRTVESCYQSLKTHWKPKNTTLYACQPTSSWVGKPF